MHIVLSTLLYLRTRTHAQTSTAQHAYVKRYTSKIVVIELHIASAFNEVCIFVFVFIQTIYEFL